ncbi:MAG: prepilin-type N-terminal cleavage/methylation domain-containing protein [Phycisphaerales bacterium]|nr:prepilin-type N-terminal cleavage/methylation domain-containing protein [Phycisphaerales bacterium]
MVEPSSVASLGRGRRAGARRGFSMLELLIVLALLAALAGLAIPAIAPRLPGARLEAGARALGQVVAQARREAIARGALALVVMERGVRGEERLGVRIWREEGSDVRGAAFPDDGPAFALEESLAAPLDAGLDDHWLVLEDAWSSLPDGVRIGPAPEGDSGEMGSTFDEGPDVGNDAEDAAIIAIVLPDGGVVMPGASLRVRARGSSDELEVTIGSATGSVGWTRIRPTEDGKFDTLDEGVEGLGEVLRSERRASDAREEAR